VVTPVAGPASRSSATVSAPGAADAPGLSCRAARTEPEREAHFRIRHQVFVREQRLFLAPGGGRGDDRDGHDTDPATIHVIGLAGGDICGTVRFYPLTAPGLWQGDRLAVLPPYRRLGLGGPLVRFAVTAAARRGGQRMEAYIQPGNVAFFEWLGWQRAGGLTSYAGIPHQRMVIDLTTVPR
jgi:putative N-acetyltransferase (TIGR04045 family)